MKQSLLIVPAIGALLALESVRADRPNVDLVRTESPPVIDGVLDDEAWTLANVFDEFTQVDPIEGAPPTERTEVRVLFDSDFIYFGVRCYATDPSTIIATQMHRDASLSANDHVTIVLDTFNDRRNGYVFLVGPAGAKRDGLLSGTSRARWEWDGIWYGEATIDDEGWACEFAIPFKTISFNPNTTTWGFNIQRVIRQKNEVVRWASARRNIGILDLGDAGTLAGIESVQQGYGLTFSPFVTGSFDFEENNQTAQAGLDVFYQVTPSITAALTINTDFAETEVDERQVNLSRFPLFFPEKRDFFLQDAGIFSFGGVRRSPIPFHSRRIGIVGGEEKGILAGAKITGRHKGLNFGILDVQMDNDGELGDKNLFVARGSLDVLEESTIGAIVTNGDPGQRGQNTLVGTDFNYRSSAFMGDKVLEAHAWVQATRSDPTGDSESDDLAFGGRVSYPNDPWEFSVFIDQVGHRFRPALGFVSRPGEREYGINGGYTWRPGDGTGFIRRIDISPSVRFFTDLSGDLETLDANIPSVNVRSRDGDFARFHIEHTREYLDDSFEIVDGVVIPAGDYATWGASTNIGTSDSRPVSVNLFYNYREFYTGIRQDYGGGLGWQPNASFRASWSYSVNDVDLDEGDFEVQISSARVDVHFSPEISWNNFIQWDNRSNNFGANSRVRWEYRPGSDLYVVYNLGLDTDDNWRSTANEAIVKVGMTFRF